MSAQDPPAEILQHIFQYISKESVYQCILVRKSWHTPAIQHYYKGLVLTKHNMDHVCERLEKKNGLEGGSWVRKIVVTKFPPDMLEPLLTYLPSLKTIEFTSGVQFKLHMDYLYSIAGKDLLPRIQDVSVPRGITIKQEIYLNICYKLRHSISHIRIYNCDKPYYNINGFQRSTLLQLLPEFTMLTHLSVHYLAVTDHPETLFVFPLLRACPNLISLLFCNPSVLIDKIGYSLLESVDYNHSYYTQLKNLELVIHCISRPYIQYITTSIPLAQLDTLVLSMINNRYQNFDEWIQGDDYSSTVMGFALRLAAVKNLTLKFSPSYGYRDLMEGRESTVKLGEAERFWQFVHNIKGNRNLNCSADFYFYDSSGLQWPRAEVKVQNNSMMKLKYEFNVQHYLGSPLSTTEGSTGEKIVNTLQIRVNTKEFTETTTAARLLENILIRFPHLNQLSISLPGLCEKLILFDPDHRDTDSTMTRSTKNIKYVHMHYLSVTTELIYTLSNNLPNIEWLTCQECTLAFDSKQTTSWDLTNIKRLKKVQVYIANSHFCFASVMVRFEYSNGDKQAYFKAETFVKGTGRKKPNFYYLAITDDAADQHQQQCPETFVITIKCNKINQFCMIDTAYANYEFELFSGSYQRKKNKSNNKNNTVY